ncbi:ATP-dependent helicase [Streptomyces diacarni]|uniref:ATP-dependent helicase n=1 Tax=Streptomyces diacarni TaxID=2800381 RepID=A0A367F2G1_9ACTN|nr:DEAD/DEAH box helicase [Streptomyces diacarni]RCG23660.1 ATP-dependent helicase [Streptomyces diacarni]
MSVTTHDAVEPAHADDAAEGTVETAVTVETATGTVEATETESAEAAVAVAEAVTATAETSVTDAAEAEEAAAEPTPTFADLGLPEAVVRKLAQNGVTAPFPIQAATIPDALAGMDVLGRGRTGSGKTLSFGLPLLARLTGGRTERKRPRGVILTPTRELAMQVSDALQPYGDTLGLRLKVVCGGTSMANQISALERGVDILVATPGRLRDLINRGSCSLDDVKTAILDEADQMADLGFLPEVTEILDLVPEGGQRMLFSATMEKEIDSLVRRYLVDPVSHEVDAAQGAVTTMTHHVLIVKPRDKAPVTAAIAGRKGRTIVFVRTQLGADRVAEQLCESGVRADALHGGMTQGARTRTLADFKDGKVNTLVATDVAARGIHVDGIDLVLNVDPAGDHKDYLHRSGRTARAGESGTVVSLALPHQRRQIFRLMEDAGVDASRHLIGRGDVFDEEVARIVGARSLTEVQAESAVNTARQAEREARKLNRQLEKAQQRAAELREEATLLIARAARERGEDADAAVAAAAEVEAEQAAEEARAEAARQAKAEAERRERERAERDRDRGERGGRPSYDRKNRDRDRGDRSYGNRDRGDRSYGRDGDRDRGDRRSSDRGTDRGGFRRDRDRDRGRDERPYGNGNGNRDRDRDRRDGGRDSGDGGARGGYRRDGGDRAFRRDGFRGGDRPYRRDSRDERRPHGRSGDSRSTSHGPGRGGPRTPDRRADKPRWKRNS